MTRLPAELDQRFVQLVSSDRVSLPPYPATAAQLSQLVATDTYSLADVTRIVSADQVLTAAVLRRANSAAAGAAQPTSSIDLAVARLGARGVSSLAMSVGIGAQAKKDGPLMALRRLVWRQALLAAEFCSQLATHRHLPPDEAFVCGLLHDFGKVIALGCIETIIARNPAPALAADKLMEVMEAYHVELGLVMAAKWRLPDEVARVITEHHAPPSSIARSAMSELVMAADFVVALLDSAPRIEAADLRDMPSLRDDRELDFVTRSALELPAVLSEYDADEGPLRRKSEPQRVERDASTLTTPQVSVSLRAECKNTELRATCLAANGVALSSPVRLSEQQVLPFSLETELGPIEFFATITRCVKEKRAFLVEARPVALPTLAHERWQALLNRHQATHAVA